MKPVLFVTNIVPPDRQGAFAELHRREGIELALFGGRSHHATGAVADPGVPHRQVAERDVAELAAGGDYRAVVCGTAGRRALPAAHGGARRAGVPFLLWSALWAHPRTPAHILAGAPLLRRLYRRADAVVTYGAHVSDFVRARGATNVYVAPQAVDNAFWSQRTAEHEPFTALFVGRDAGYKGLDVLERAWELAALDGRLIVAGVTEGSVPSATRHGPVGPEELRNLYGVASVLVMPALFTREFREPWGLVANEAMNQRVPVIATDAVGAAAGGLVRHERNGLVVPAGDATALAAALKRLHDDPGERDRLGTAAARDVAAFTYEAWAAGFSGALATIGAARGDC